MKAMNYETESAMRRLIHHYAELLDEGRIEELCELFRYGEIVMAGQVFAGPDGVREMIGQTIYYDANGNPADPSRMYATTRAIHYVSNINAYFDADEQPAATSKLLVIQQRKRELCTVLGGRYMDAFVEVDGALWFKRRILELHLIGDSLGYFKANPYL
jgi:hypothetical protein